MWKVNELVSKLVVNWERLSRSNSDECLLPSYLDVKIPGAEVKTEVVWFMDKIFKSRI